MDAHVTSTSFSSGRHRGFFLSRAKLALLCAFLACSYIAVALISYNIAQSDSAGVAAPPVPACSRTDYITAAVTTHATGGSNLSSAAAAKSSFNEVLNRVTTTGYDVRLPRSAAPLWYNIKLVPFLIEGNFTFNGEVTIAVKILEDCRNVTLHTVALTIYEVRVYRAVEATLTEIRIARKSVDALRQFFIIETQEMLKKGEQLHVYIRYQGVLDDYLQGFYRSSYTVDNEKR